MTNLLFFRNIFLFFSCHKLISKCMFSFFVLSFLIYNNTVYGTNEIEKTNANINDFFLNNFSQLSKNNDESLLVNIPPSNITNLTHNDQDSVYGQIAALENNVYLVWQESIGEKVPKQNYDIYFMKSQDNGETFDKPINISNNIGFSEHPQIAVSKNGIFVVWADNTNSNNTEIMFSKSLDNGTTFGEVRNLSNNLKNSNNVEISVSNQNVYVVWQDSDPKTKESNIIFKASLDNGNTFNDAIEISNKVTDSYPKINSYDDYVYLVWNSENTKSSNDGSSGLFFVKSSDRGNHFDKNVQLSDTDFGEAQLSADENEVLVVWGGIHSKNIHNLYFVKSNNNGNSFTNPEIIFNNIFESNSKNYNENLAKTINNPRNVELPTNDLSFIVWQDKLSENNEDILLMANNKAKNDYSKILNLSNNNGISECPSIAISDNNLYILWEDINPGNHEIFFWKFFL